VFECRHNDLSSREPGIETGSGKLLKNISIRIRSHLIQSVFNSGWDNFRSIGNKSNWRSSVAAVLVATGLAPTAARADPGVQVLDQQRLQRQQQQEALQLRMQQQDNVIRSAPASDRARQAVEESQLRQRQRQEATHYRQSVEAAPAQPSDDAGTRQAKETMRRQAAARENHEERPQSRSEPAAGK